MVKIPNTFYSPDKPNNSNTPDNPNNPKLGTRNSPSLQISKPPNIPHPHLQPPTQFLQWKAVNNNLHSPLTLSTPAHTLPHTHSLKLTAGFDFEYLTSIASPFACQVVTPNNP